MLWRGGVEPEPPRAKPAARKPSAAKAGAKASADADSDEEVDDDDDDDNDNDTASPANDSLPGGAVGVINMYQSDEKGEVDVAVFLHGAEDGSYLITFTYAASNMEAYTRILQKKFNELPKLRPYELSQPGTENPDPNPKRVLQLPRTVDGTGPELCPDRRVLGGLKVCCAGESVHTPSVR